MLKKTLTCLLVLAFAILFTGCAENEHHVTQTRETKTETAPQDKSPGTMVVE